MLDAVLLGQQFVDACATKLAVESVRIFEPIQLGFILLPPIFVGVAFDWFAECRCVQAVVSLPCLPFGAELIRSGDVSAMMGEAVEPDVVFGVEWVGFLPWLGCGHGAILATAFGKGHNAARSGG
jgi:hypothetical protein